jgi:uncharacterized membrane protein YjjP (DUF1212 family)
VPKDSPREALRRLRRHAIRYAIRYAPRGRSTEAVPRAQDKDREWTRNLASLLCELGVELLRAGEQTTQVQTELRDVAARYGMRARAFVVPTGLFVRVDRLAAGAEGELDFAPVAGPGLRLDQVQLLRNLLDRMKREPVPFEQVRAALHRERSLPQRFSPAATVVGYLLLTVGLGAVLHATWAAVAGYAVLGAGVGVLRLLVGRYLPTAATVLPVAAAILVTALALRFAGPVLHETPGNLFIPPLIAFLPGAALTLGAIELAAGDAISGVARLAAAGNVLLLLGLGILVGTEIVHAHPIGQPVPGQLGRWASWCGVLLLGAGFTLYHSAPARTLGWLTGALLLERAVQQAGSALGGAALGAFAAGMLLPPMADWVQRHHRVPDQVVFLPCFWMLVPGSSGLSGVSQLLQQHNANSLASLLDTAITVIAIALGILVGAGFRRRTHLEVAPEE